MQRFSAVWYVLFASLLQAQDIDFGAAEISSQPNGAAVYIEGFLLGTTPLIIPQLLPERSYSLVVRKDGHADVLRDLRVTAGEVAKISIGLRLGSRLSAVRDEDDWSPALRGQGKSGETRRSVKRFRSYTTLEIANFLMKADRSVPPTLGYSLLPQLARRLEVKAAFERFVTIYTDGPSPRWSEGGRRYGRSSSCLVRCDNPFQSWQQGNKAHSWKPRQYRDQMSRPRVGSSNRSDSARTFRKGTSQGRVRLIQGSEELGEQYCRGCKSELVIPLQEDVCDAWQL